MSQQPYRFFSRAWPWERVLDVGSGDNPHPRADSLIDLYVTDEHRWGALARPSSVGIADAERLPFADGSFDVAIAAHCLEHCARPDQVATELSRVARRGVVEVPTPYLDVLLSPSPYHRWVFARRGADLVYAEARPHNLEFATAPITVQLLRHDPLFRTAYLLDTTAFRTRLHWSGRVHASEVAYDDVIQALGGPLTAIKWRDILLRAAGRALLRWVDTGSGLLRRRLGR